MARTHLHFRTWAGLFVLTGLIFIFLRAGFWQLDRAHTRDMNAIAIQEAQAKPRITLGEAIQTFNSNNTLETYYWRHIQAQGQWLHEFTLFIDNRNHNGVPGFWVATPLQTDSQHAVLVLRGWLPRDSVLTPGGSQERVQTNLINALKKADNPKALQGQVYPHVPRVFELWGWAGGQQVALQDLLTQSSATAIVSNLAINELDKALPLTLMPFVISQTSANPGSPSMVQEWPHPSSDADTNRGYALQWFSFSAIAATIWLAWLIKLWRRSHQQKDTR